MEQAMAVHELAKFRPKTEMIWRESVEVAAHSYVLARRLTKINPDEALLTGLLLDIGKFYLLARASHFPELADDTAELDRMLDEWHPSIGSAILGSLDLPETTLFAVAEHHGDAVSHPLRKLVDVIVVASRIVARNSASGGSSDGGKADAVDADSLRAVEEGKDELRSIVSGLSRS
jgi:HD-like signal output (HDOD) protein